MAGKIFYGYSYWVWYVLIGTIISIPAFASDAFWDAYPMPMMLYTVILLASRVYLIVGTWRSAENYKKIKRKKKQSVFWGYAGQVTIVLSVIRGIAEVAKSF